MAQEVALAEAAISTAFAIERLTMGIPRQLSTDAHTQADLISELIFMHCKD